MGKVPRKNAVLEIFSGKILTNTYLLNKNLSPYSHECCDNEVKEIGMCVGSYFPGL